MNLNAHAAGLMTPASARMTGKPSATVITAALRCQRCVWNIYGQRSGAESGESMTYNLIVLFERHLGWKHKVTLRSLRFWLFVTAGVLSHPVDKTTIKLAVPERERDGWWRLWEKILNPYPTATQ